MSAVPGTMDTGKQGYQRYLLKNKTRIVNQNAEYVKDKSMPSMVDSEKQGFMGHLEKKTPQELRDLLNRQNKLLENKKFISRLADKGARIEQLAEKIKSLLNKEAVSVDDTALMLEKLDIEAEHKNRARTAINDDEILEQIVNKDHQDKIVEDLRDEVGMETSHRRFYNSYENVVREVEQKQISQNETSKKFLPSKSIKAHDIHSFPEEEYKKLKSDMHIVPTSSSHHLNQSDTKLPNTSTNHMNQSEERLHPSQTISKSSSDGDVAKHKSRHRYGYDDSLVMDMHRSPLNHRPAQLISIEESVKVIEQQEKLHEELMTKHAVERLSERLHIRVGAFNPEGASASSLIYRESTLTGKSDDENSDGPEMDYPD